MKHLTKALLVLLLLVTVTSCCSIKVATDYDTEANFTEYKTFAFSKTGIDKAEISDLDKRRILRAIETELLNKGLQKSESPDLLISLFTKSNERVNVYNNTWGWGAMGPGWGWNWNRQPHVSTSTEGKLFIDLIDAKNAELVWQGIGTGFLTQNTEKKDALIKEFVSKIMAEYPPEK